MPASRQLVLDLAQLGPHPLRDRDALEREAPAPCVFAQMCVKPRKSNVSGLPRPRSCRRSAANRPNSIRRVFSGCSSRPNFASRSRRSREEPLGVAMVLEPDDEVVGEAHDDHVAVRVPASATGRPTGRRRSAGRRSPAAAKPIAPCGVPSSVSDHVPSSITPALSHCWIRRRIRSSAIRCSRNFTSQPWSMAGRRSRGCPRRAPSSPSSA